MTKCDTRSHILERGVVVMTMFNTETPRDKGS